MDIDTDLHAWLKEQAMVLRTRNFEFLDVDNLVEELDAMAGSQRRELKNRLKTLLLHLLKWQFLPQVRTLASRTWKLTIDEQRRQIIDIFEESPSLRAYLSEVFMEMWQRACKDFRTDFDVVLPEICPWDLELILTEDFMPS